MNNPAMFSLLVCCGLLICMCAWAQTRYQTATVMSVIRIDRAPQNYMGGNPSDAPNLSKEYAYRVGLKLNCTLHVGRYESATDYLPTFFGPQTNLNVRLAKYWMYVSLPWDHEVKLGLVSHHAVHEGSCAQ